MQLDIKVWRSRKESRLDKNLEVVSINIAFHTMRLDVIAYREGIYRKSFKD